MNPCVGVFRVDDASSDNGSTHRFDQLYQDEVPIEKLEDFLGFESSKVIQDIFNLKKNPFCYCDELG